MMDSDTSLKSKDVVSVAVKVGKNITLYKLNQGLPLQIIIKQLCEERKINFIPNYYALQITDTKDSNINKYITEDNRKSYITNGCELRLIYSAAKMCEMIHEKIISKDELEWTLRKLSSLSKDKTFSEEFVAINGMSTLVSLIKKAEHPYDMVHLCLETLLSFHYFNLITNFEDIPSDNLISFVKCSQAIPENVIEHSLHLLKHLLTFKKVPTSLTKIIRNNVNTDDVIHFFHLKHNPHLQEKAMAYLNALLMNSQTCDSDMISHLEARKVREIIWKNIIMNSDVTPGMAQELYKFQNFVLKELSSKLNTFIEAQSDEAMDLQELHNISYSVENNIKRDSILSYLEEQSLDKQTSESTRISTCEYDPFAEKQRFSNRSTTSVMELENNDAVHYSYSRSQILDINLLTLNCMQYFSRKQLKLFTKIKLMEEKLQKKPFHSICDRLVHLLCDALLVNEKSTSDCTCYQPLIFEATKESPFFEELFCRVAVRLSSTSKEMKARTSQDVDKVMKVLRQQVTTVLSRQLQSWKKIEEELQNLTYEKVVETWESKNDQILLKLHDLPAVSNYRENLKVEMEELISRHRLHLLCQGSKFIKVNSRSHKPKKRFWFIYLSPNYTVFHYGDYGESESEEVESLSKISVSIIKELVVGKKCPHVRDAKSNRKTEPEFAFSLILDQEEPSHLDFIAESQQMYDYWTDGLNYLLGGKMKSKTMGTELKVLMDMEVRLHLLDLEGINIPHESPTIPSDPTIIDISEY